MSFLFVITPLYCKILSPASGITSRSTWPASPPPASSPPPVASTMFSTPPSLCATWTRSGYDNDIDHGSIRLAEILHIFGNMYKDIHIWLQVLTFGQWGPVCVFVFVLFIKMSFRDSFWRDIGIEDKTDPRRKQFVKDFFTGSEKPFTKEEDAEMKAILYSPAFQEAYCNYLIHTSIIIIAK